MSEWLKIDPKRLEKNEMPPPLEGDVCIQMRMSPYDIPDAFRAAFDSDINRFIIEFRYISEEAWRHQRIGDHVVARVGKHSGRIYALEIDVKSVNVESVQIALLGAADEGIDHLAAAFVNKGVLSDRYKVAKEAIHAAGELLPDVFRRLAPLGRVAG